jgi:hypothetical protein
VLRVFHILLGVLGVPCDLNFDLREQEFFITIAMSSRRKTIWISKFLSVSAVSFDLGCGFAAPCESQPVEHERR